MKKVLAAILLVTYFAFSSGVVVNYHYCMDQLASAKLFEKDSDVCGMCGMHNSPLNDCCRDEVKVFKSTDDQTSPASLSFIIKAPQADAVELSSFLFLPIRNHSESIFAVAHPPPLLTEQDTYLQNRVFRI